MTSKLIRSVLLGVGRPFRPLVRVFCWWTPLHFGPFHGAVLMPDSMAIVLLAVGGIWLLPYVGWISIPIYCVAVLLSPVVLLTLLHIRESEVTVIRLVGFIPYWFHRVPADARFDLFEAWEDPAPTGVAFEAKAYGANPLHLGTSRSAEPLFAYVGSRLEKAGWKRGALGYQKSSSNGTNAL